MGGLLVAGAIAAAVVFSGAKDKDVERETSGFVIETVNAISGEWNPQELIDRAEPGLIDAMASQGQSVSDLFAVYRKLGALQSPPACRLKDTSQFGAADSYTTASYSCEAQYDNGSAALLITLRRGKARPEWRVYYLNISSPYFSQLDYQRTK
jgi:hypothetical protein